LKGPATSNYQRRGPPINGAKWDQGLKAEPRQWWQDYILWLYALFKRNKGYSYRNAGFFSSQRSHIYSPYHRLHYISTSSNLPSRERTRTEGNGQNNTLSPQLVWKSGKAAGFMFLRSVSGMLMTHYVVFSDFRNILPFAASWKKTVISGNAHTPYDIPEQPQHSS
jgi:hypothetical protein